MVFIMNLPLIFTLEQESERMCLVFSSAYYGYVILSCYLVDVLCV